MVRSQVLIRWHNKTKSWWISSFWNLHRYHSSNINQVSKYFLFKDWSKALVKKWKSHFESSIHFEFNYFIVCLWKRLLLWKWSFLESVSINWVTSSKLTLKRQRFTYWRSAFLKKKETHNSSRILSITTRKRTSAPLLWNK